ncbi:DUF2789 domain-containing protein [Shewanella salipaludis]|uniref:DUF2789 domain-containing protein n=1 Tax=Shewanella salipaludis TaxID=2723052 RepID=A0A972FST0_9GAMM|nr:DUF2789 domain-containing protein [Shewanella salipaludis]NMH64579.1 DUF2789 domain-containing protein [Shewanella salipaludis]
MDTTPVDISHLFEQLGLDSKREAIEQFIAGHSLSDNELLAQASFWTPSQRAFLNEALEEDAEWSDAIDHLDTLLRK